MVPWQAHVVTTEADGASVYIADVDGDGNMDLAARLKMTTRLRGTKRHRRSWVTTNIIYSRKQMAAFSVHAADIDGDGDMDVASASINDDKIAWYENTNGDGSVWEVHVVTTDRLCQGC